jgi:hypothetical protein
MSFALRAEDGRLSVRLDPQFRQAPAKVLVRIPWFFDLRAAEADGRPIQPAEGHLALAPATRELTLRGHIKPGTPALSYDVAVEQYKQEYRRRYEEFLRTGLRSQ